MLRENLMKKNRVRAGRVANSDRIAVLQFVASKHYVEAAAVVRGVAKVLYEDAELYAAHEDGVRLLLTAQAGFAWISPSFGKTCESPLLDWMVHPRFVGFKSALVAARLAYKVDTARRRYFDCVGAMHLSDAEDPWGFCPHSLGSGRDAGWSHLVAGRYWLAQPQGRKIRGRLRRGTWEHITVVVSTFSAAPSTIGGTE